MANSQDSSSNEEGKKRRRVSKESRRKAMRVFKYFRPHRAPYAVGFFFLILTSFTTILFPELMGRLVNAGSLPKSTSHDIWELKSINAMLAVMLVVFGAQAVFSFFRVYLFGYVTQKVLKQLRQDSFDNIIKLPMSFFSSRQVGELNSRIAADISLLGSTFTTTIAEFVRQTLVVIFSITMITIVSWKLTALLLLALPPLILVALIFGRFIKKLSKRGQDKIAESNVVVQEAYSGIVNVKSFANEGYEMTKYERLVDQVKEIALKRAFWRAGFVSMIVLFMTCTSAFVVWYGATLQSEGEITHNQLTVFIFYTIFIATSFSSLPTLYTQLIEGIGATENLMDLVEEEGEDIETGIERIGLHGDLAFRNVSFYYPSRPDVQVLKEISFDVSAGQQVAIVGGSGAGKSTVAGLLLRFYDPSSGSIEVDGKDYTQYPLSRLRDEMAVVPQEVLLFGGTIEENIAYGKPGASQEEIQQAAVQANAHDFISEFPDGYNTLVGDRGIQLSGGQRQRVAIARAILNDPRILILDEATSSLDSESESVVQEALDKLMKGRTSIVIAHRLSTIRKADKILVLHKGELVETGTHDELFEKTDGIYRRLCEFQFMDETMHL